MEENVIKSEERKVLEKKLSPAEKLRTGDSRTKSRFLKLAGMSDNNLLNVDAAYHIFESGAAAMSVLPVCDEDDRGGGVRNIVETLDDYNPKDAIEARLVLQANALFHHGMVCLKRSETAEMSCHGEYYINKAIKMLRLHNETIEAINRHRNRGEQRVVVQHQQVNVGSGGKAVIGQVHVGEGEHKENIGENSCSENYVEQKQEPMAISHVDSPQWPMGDVDSMEASVPVQKQ